jgi:hypothetical protein
MRYDPTINLSQLLGEDETPQRLSSAWAVESLSAKKLDKYDFQIPGDSGSLAFTMQGKLAGLFFMALRDDLMGAFGVGYMIPISELLADIEKLTGARVEIPS